MKDSNAVKTLKPVVTQHGNQGVAQSENVAAVFGKRPYDVFSMIGRKVDRLAKLGRNPARYFSLRNYIGKDGKEHGSYEMTRKGFDYLVLSFTGEKADKYKLCYIDLFHEYEAVTMRINANKQLPEWQNARQLGKAAHSEYTDAGKAFLELAAKQRGNDNYAKHFYSNMAKAKLTALFSFPIRVKPARDLVNAKQLRRLEGADNVVDIALLAGIDLGTDHKEIFQDCVKAINTFATVTGGVETIEVAALSIDPETDGN